MPFDGLRPFAPALPEDVAEAAAAARAAEQVLARRMAPGEDWAQAGVPDLAFEAVREAFRAAHALAVEWRDEAAEAEDPDAWEDEPFED